MCFAYCCSKIIVILFYEWKILQMLQIFFKYAFYFSNYFISCRLQQPTKVSYTLRRHIVFIDIFGLVVRCTELTHIIGKEFPVLNHRSLLEAYFTTIPSSIWWLTHWLCKQVMTYCTITTHKTHEEDCIKQYFAYNVIECVRTLQGMMCIIIMLWCGEMQRNVCI